MQNTDFSLHGYGYITEKIHEAVSNGSRTATVSGCWMIDREIRLPENFTLVLEDCHLRMADGCFSNMFVNEHHDTDVGRTTAGTDKNITLIGRGKAILDGGKYNGLSERTQLKDGLPPVWKNNLILFTNVDGFKIEGISCRNQRWWAMNFIHCSNGYIGGVDFCSSDIGIDENGNEYHGLKTDAYEQILVKNSDGIDIRRGCHDIIIENVSGFTEDDSVALTALDGALERAFAVEGLISDIYNITVKNVRTAALCTNVRLLNQSGLKLHDVLIDGVYDTAKESPHMDLGIYAVRIGDTYLYGSRHATEDETYNITVRNVRGGERYVIGLAGRIGKLTMENIEAFGGAELLRDERS